MDKKNFNASQYKYHKKAIKRIPLDVQKEYYENILKPCAKSQGETINGFIKKAINERIERIKGIKKQ